MPKENKIAEKTEAIKAFAQKYNINLVRVEKELAVLDAARKYKEAREKAAAAGKAWEAAYAVDKEKAKPLFQEHLGLNCKAVYALEGLMKAVHAL